jgi:hypothetical protein
MTERTVETSPRFKARMAGVFYLLTFLTGLATVPSFRLVVSGDAAATATNILAHVPLIRLGSAALLINVVVYIAVTLLFYDLFKPVNRSLSRLAAFFSLVGCAIQAFACLFELAPLAVLGGAPYLSVFKVEQLHALALMSFELYAQAYNIGLVFFGFYCLLIGYLIFRSTFLPRILGVAMAFAGLAWLTFLSPPLANYLSPYNMALGALAELSLTLWLLVMGVKVERWREQANAA